MGTLHKQKEKKSEGYGQFFIKRNERKLLVYTHRYSYELSYGPIPEGIWVLHKCDNSRCVNPDHLFLGTHIDSMKDAAQKGRMLNHTKLTATQVLEIRRLAGTMTQYEIGAMFGVTNDTISVIVCRKAWKHLPIETSTPLSD